MSGSAELKKRNFMFRQSLRLRRSWKSAHFRKFPDISCPIRLSKSAPLLSGDIAQTRESRRKVWSASLFGGHNSTNEILVFILELLRQYARRAPCGLKIDEGH